MTANQAVLYAIAACLAGAPLAVIDCYGILTDDKIRRYFELGCEVKGLGRGHIQRIKEEVRKTAKI